ncbi:Uncharacterized conserved protein, DUF1800 family [Chitinophaga sp. CF118]|uniref:DUF1800 domain-containing protein n=1 Tax=Chitinophaga sp. CF118 TaxID=1884367 RepID=UPI0008EB026F|nr:DUF1800 domain-containing protein [Chitinophaga sp. CF118]SFD25113.1 Uncharacterized conserved protein, DUF1800 family [Chitinophaga sp. CF118]
MITSIPGKLQMQHLAWRAGFGENHLVIEDWARKRRKQIVDNVMIGNEKEKSEPLIVTDESDLPDTPKKEMTLEEKKMERKMQMQGIKELNIAWINVMINTEHPLREKMALFWHGHFAARTTRALFSQQLLEVIRTHALGNFGDLLTEVSKSPAMLEYLNNKQNRKAHPNENFAREVMELFTLGRGNYTETDVKESARAFTGWGYDVDGNFQFREKEHDRGEKTVLGKTGDFNGDDVLKILLEHKQTAKFITTKIYKFFVDDVVDEEKVNALADKFYASGYNIKSLMQNIFMADWFYDKRYIGGHIKSPIELIVGLRRTIPVKFEKEEVMLSFQQILGQVLFYPPNVAGWPGGRNWIDSSSLMYRMQLPQMILYDKESVIMPKEITPEMGMTQYKAAMQVNEALKKQYAKKISAEINWQPYLKEYDKVKRENLADSITDTLLLTNMRVNKQLLDRYADSSSRESYIKTVTIAIMSTPEYQMC